MASSSLTVFFLLILPALVTMPCSAQPLPRCGRINSPIRSHGVHLETYIIHVRKPHRVAEFASPAKRLEWHQSFLPPTALSDREAPRIIYSYRSAISGFAAMLTREELRAVEGMEGFLHAQRDEVLRVRTTHTPEFLELRRGQGLWQQSDHGRGLIIGVLDTGIHPGHPSFQDNGLLPSPPQKWRGRCDLSDPDRCNNKLIGAVSCIAADVDRSPLDQHGHGTHVAGTAAGMFAVGAKVIGMAPGTAAGTAPYAHLAAYKVMRNDGSGSMSDVLAGIDQAIHDGVDVISMSLGWSENMHFYQSSIAIGSLSAIEQGIFVSAAAGNEGPNDVTVENDAPWILTVGASTTDRALRATLRLGNGVMIQGETIYQPADFDPSQSHQLTYPGAGGDPAKDLCAQGSLDGLDVRGLFVMCSRDPNNRVLPSTQGEVVKRAGGAAVIHMNQEDNGYTIELAVVSHPAIAVSYADAQVIKRYVDSHAQTQDAPQATLEFHGTLFGMPNSRAVASFSGRGPSWANNGGVLKPDILGPGVNILAASPFQIGPPRQSDPYDIMYGTSMATPHLSGVAALLKRVHGDWSPAAIRSAIMTTADRLDRNGRPIADQRTGNAANDFAMGVGHVSPTKAVDPGLVYDIDFGGYLSYVCGLGYTQQQVDAINRGRHVDCSNPITSDQLNYPSLSAVMGPRQQKVLTRSLTNVGEDNSVYTVRVQQPMGVTVRVAPERLEFTAAARRLNFQVTLTTEETASSFSSGMLRWVSSDNNHVVASSITVLFRGVRQHAGGLPQYLMFPNATTERFENTAGNYKKSGKGSGASKLERSVDARKGRSPWNWALWHYLRRWFA